jgi:SET domain-containing protein
VRSAVGRTSVVRRTREAAAGRGMKEAPLRIGKSRISGRGAFATKPIRKGARIIEYLGERISAAEADARYKGGPAKHPRVLLFTVDRDTVIDAGVGGNDARFINHSCEPNCEAITRGSRIWIYALRKIQIGEELTYDYSLTGGPEDRGEQKRSYACRCGARTCRHTMFKLD